ncbi:MAG TPA: POTRA domain-containing protein, partial [Terriglobales bacterium]|nr:POTRA domain-containing protein [Terriglobales bacterium]
MFLFCSGFGGQSGPTAAPQQAPQTAPQLKQVLPSYEGQKVVSVELAGQPGLDTRQLLPLLAQKANQPFTQAKVDQSMAALKKTGRFQSVELEIRPEATGVRVLFVLQPAVYFGVYEFPGATSRFAYSRLVMVSNYPPRGAFTPVDVEEARKGLVEFFQRNGYFEAQVQPTVQVDKQHGLANVIFNTTLGKKAKFGKVDITGTTPAETEKLRSVLHSLMARLKGSAIREGKPYNYKTVQNATLRLQGELMEQGHLGGTVKLVGANYDPETRKADVNFTVKTGPVVHVQLQGIHVWSWTKKKLLPVYQQVGLDPELIQEGRQNLLSYAQSKGYFDAKVTTRTQQGPKGETIFYDVVKGPRHKVAEVNITGNQHLSDKVLQGHVKVEEGHLFGHGKYSEKLAKESAKNLKGVYQANGFSSVSVTPQVSTKNDNLVVTFRVDEGPQDVVQTLTLEGNTVPLSQLAPKGLKVRPGQGYSTKHVDDDRNQLIARYLDLGYLNATFRAKATPIGGDKHQLAVVYQIYEGPQVHTASVVTLGRKDTRQTLISRETRPEIPVGKPLREDKMLSSENKLYTLGIFDWAEVDPRRQVTTQTQEDVVVKVHEAKKNTITYGFGFQVINRGGSVPSGTVALPGLPPVGLSKNFKTSEKTFWGPTGTFEYTRTNVRGKAETLTIGGFGGRLDQRGTINFQDPHFRGTNWASNLSLAGEHNSENPIFTDRLADFGAQLQRALNPDRTTNLFLRYGLRQTGITRLLIPDLVPVSDRHVRLSTVSTTYLRDTRDNALDAHKGLYESYEFGLTPSALGSSVDFARFMGQAAYYKDIFHGIIWANSIRLGLEQPFSNSHVPLSEKFFSGGGSTLRGFPLNGAGPQRTIPACGNPSDP